MCEPRSRPHHPPKPANGRIPIGSSGVEHPPGGFREVPSHRPYCFLMALSLSDSGTKLSHMTEGIFWMVAGNRVGGFTISPLEIAIYVLPGLSVA